MEATSSILGARPEVHQTAGMVGSQWVGGGVGRGQALVLPGSLWASSGPGPWGLRDDSDLVSVPREFAGQWLPRVQRDNSAAPAPRSMLPDVVDDFQLQHQSGPGMETIFYSSYVFFTKLSGAGALGISTLSLE